MVVIARFDRRRFDRPAAQAGSAHVVFAQMGLDDSQQVPFDLWTDDAFPAARRKPPRRHAQHLARREMERPAVVEIFVPQDPADAVGPWQNPEGRRVGHNGQIGRTGHFGQAHAAAGRERGENAGAGGIQRRRGNADIETFGQGRNESRNGQGFRSRIAVGVTPGQPDKTQFLAFDPAQQVRGEPSLLVAPKAVSFNETRSLALCHLQAIYLPHVLPAARGSDRATEYVSSGASTLPTIARVMPRRVRASVRRCRAALGPAGVNIGRKPANSSRQRLVSRFRSSHDYAAPWFANFGIERTLATY